MLPCGKIDIYIIPVYISYCIISRSNNDNGFDAAVVVIAYR